MAKILIIEDNEASRDMLSRRLSRFGYTVVVAKDGPEGIRLAETEAPDLILMDYRLPGMDGWQVTWQMKNTTETATIPIIAVTAHDTMRDVEGALSAGCDDFMAKPIDIVPLLRKIGVLLARKSGTCQEF